MAYMFVAMQLMAPTTRRPGQVAENRSAAPSGSTPTLHQAQSAPEAPPQFAKLPPSPEPEIAASGGGKSYKIVAGDTLRTIAARVYGRAGLWDRISKANPGLDPRHLRVGRVIKLPAHEPRR
jgi:nucleoid-associated protein YgaU